MSSSTILAASLIMVLCVAGCCHPLVEIVVEQVLGEEGSDNVFEFNMHLELVDPEVSRK